VFGHRKKVAAPTGPEVVSVDARLEDDIQAVEEAVRRCLDSPGEAARQQLSAALQVLDDQVDRSDAYDGSIVDSPMFGTSTKYSVIGETSAEPLAEYIPGSVLQSQMALVKAAKQWIDTPSSDALAALRTASAALPPPQPVEPHEA
jgi:hypothetical protein